MSTNAERKQPAMEADGKGNVKTDEIRQQIIDAAAKAFMTRGYAATSIDAIAELVHATKGLVYYYFKSKGDLYLAIHLQAMESSLSTLTPIAREPTSPSVRMKKMIAVHARLLMNNFAMHKVSLEGVNAHLSGSTTPAQRVTLFYLISKRDEYENLYLEVLHEGMATGEFRQMDARITAKFLLGSVNWMTIWFRPQVEDGKSGNDHIANEAADFALGAIVNSELQELN